MGGKGRTRTTKGSKFTIPNSCTQEAAKAAACQQQIPAWAARSCNAAIAFPGIHGAGTASLQIPTSTETPDSWNKARIQSCWGISEAYPEIWQPTFWLMPLFLPSSRCLSQLPEGTHLTPAPRSNQTELHRCCSTNTSSSCARDIFGREILWWLQI